MRTRSLLSAIVAVLSVTFGSTLAMAGQRVALSIGVSAYQSSPLPSPVKDATEVSRALAGFGFDVTLVSDPNSATFSAAVEAFIQKARGAEAAVVYFSGHGMQVNGEVYMLPSDSGGNYATLLQRDEFSVNGIVERLQRAGVDFKFVIVDACRNNPFVNENGRAALATANAGRAESRIPATNTLVSFASSSGQVSQDWGANASVGLSLYTAALLDVIRRNPGIEVRELTQQTRVLVQEMSSRDGEVQNPSESSSMVRPVRLELTQGGSVVAFDGTARRNDGALAGNLAPRPASGRMLERVALLFVQNEAGRTTSPSLAPQLSQRPLGDGRRAPARPQTDDQDGPTVSESLPADAVTPAQRGRSPQQLRPGQETRQQDAYGARRGQTQQTRRPAQVDEEDGMVLSADEG